MVCCEDFEKVGAETRPLGPKKFFFFIFLHSLCHFHSARQVCAYHGDMHKGMIIPGSKAISDRVICC